MTEAGDGAYFGYFPGDRTPIHNASLLIAGFLARLHGARPRCSTCSPRSSRASCWHVASPTPCASAGRTAHSGTCGSHIARLVPSEFESSRTGAPGSPSMRIWNSSPRIVIFGMAFILPRRRWRRRWRPVWWRASSACLPSAPPRPTSAGSSTTWATDRSRTSSTTTSSLPSRRPRIPGGRTRSASPTRT